MHIPSSCLGCLLGCCCGALRQLLPASRPVVRAVCSTNVVAPNLHTLQHAKHNRHTCAITSHHQSHHPPGGTTMPFVHQLPRMMAKPAAPACQLAHPRPALASSPVSKRKQLGGTAAASAAAVAAQPRPSAAAAQAPRTFDYNGEELEVPPAVAPLFMPIQASMEPTACKAVEVQAWGRFPEVSGPAAARLRPQAGH